MFFTKTVLLDLFLPSHVHRRKDLLKGQVSFESSDRAKFCQEVPRKRKRITALKLVVNVKVNGMWIVLHIL